MNQIGFKGYAQSLGFDPVQAPDESSKILRAGQQEINNLEKTSQWNKQQRDEFQSALVRKNQLEIENRRTNFALESQWKRDYFDGILKNENTKTLSIQNSLDQNISNYALLGQFSDTAYKLVTEYKKKRDEQAELEGAAIVSETGVTLEQYQKLKAGEDQVDAADTALQGLANNAPSAEIRARILGLSGRKLVGATKQWLIQGGQEYGAWVVENSRKPITVNGVQTTLDEARDKSPEQFAAASTVLKTEYLKRYTGISYAMQDKYLMEGMRRFEANDNAAYRERREKSLQLAEDVENTNTLITEINKGQNPQAAIDWYMRGSGGDKAMIAVKRREMIGIYEKAAGAGQFGSQELEALEGHGISLGTAAPQRFGDLYGTELKGLRDAVKGYNRAKAQEQEDALQNTEKEFQTKFYENKTQLGRNYNKAELRQLRSLWEQQVKTPVPGWLKSEESNESVSSELADEQLQHLENYNMLTTTELYKGIYNNDTIAKWKERASKNGAIAGVSASTKENTTKQIDQALKGTLESLGRGFNQNSSYYVARERANRDFNSRVKALFSSGTLSADQAYSQAAAEIAGEIAKGQTGQGAYALKGEIINGKFQAVLGEKAAFAMASSNGTTSAQLKRSADIQRRVAVNPESLKTVKYLTEPEIKQIQAFAKSGSGSLPPLLSSISSNLKNVSIFDVADAQMVAYGLTPISRPSTAKLYDEISPEVRSMLTWRPSRARTVQALERSGQPYAPLLDLIASNESHTTDPGNKGYDAFNRKGAGGTYPRSNSLNGTKISQLTVGEIMAEQAAGRLYAVGRYQYIPSTLASRVQKGIINTSDIFNAQTQDKLAISSIKNKASRFFSGTATSEQVIPGLGNEWHGLQLISTQRQKEVLEQTKRNLQHFNVDSSDWKPGIVYRVSGIGPKGRTTYGPHIDAKLSDNSYFDRNYLDKYVDVAVGGKRVPVSTGQTVNGGEFGASRDGGARVHTGWDYALPEGTPVYLKNGAYVVRKQKTDWGTKLTIALPDGRTVNFLHGDG
jgi:hypothetical protein